VIALQVVVLGVFPHFAPMISLPERELHGPYTTDLEKKLEAWERFYDYDRPHGAHKGKTPDEALREKPS
jgi:hypothetical protein